MGKGDKKTRRGKITKGSYGNKRMRKASLKYEKVEVTEEKKADIVEAKPKVTKKATTEKKAKKATKTVKKKATAAKKTVAKKVATKKVESES